jgi:hypothetical protein
MMNDLTHNAATLRQVCKMAALLKLFDYAYEFQTIDLKS